MKGIFVALFVLLLRVSFAQNLETTQLIAKSMLGNLKNGDSLTYYQCHVEEGVQRLVSSSGQTVTGNSQAYTITEKFCVIKNNETFLVKYFTSSLTVFPNKKFSGLKIREKEYWQFKQDSVFYLNEKALKTLAWFENKGREAMEYDYPITKYTTNQVIIKQHKNFKQLVIDGNYCISKFLLQNL